MARTSSSTAETFVVRATSRRYAVVGSTDEQIATVIGVAGPLHHGVRHAAYTKWKVGWRLARSGAVAGEPEVLLDIETTLPRWLACTRAPAELVARWTAFEAGLEEHERGHAEVGRGAAERIYAALRARGGLAFDDDLEASLRAEVDTILDRAHAADRHYDEATRHGAEDPRIRNFLPVGG